MERFLARVPQFHETAKANEKLFRSVLDRLSVDASEIIEIPEIKEELTIDEILGSYSPENRRYGQFSIIDFQLGPITDDPFLSLAKDELLIAITNLALLSGSGAVLKYKQPTPDGEIEFAGVMLNWRS